VKVAGGEDEPFFVFYLSISLRNLLMLDSHKILQQAVLFPKATFDNLSHDG
jgi:hypothetical protein